MLSVVSLLVWPFRMVWLLVSRRQGFRKARIKKLIFLGLDGLDPGLAERFMAEGKLPNLSRLKEQGSYSQAAHHISRALAGGLVDLRHRRESGEAQHLRFSESRSEDVRAGAFFVQSAAAASRC